MNGNTLYCVPLKCIHFELLFGFHAVPDNLPGHTNLEDKSLPEALAPVGGAWCGERWSRRQGCFATVVQVK